MTWGDHGDDIRIYNQESGDISPTIERLNVLRSLQELSVSRYWGEWDDTLLNTFTYVNMEKPP